MSHHRQAVTAPGAPAAIGPYVHAVRAGGLLFCSGQIPLDPDSGELVGDDPPSQLRQCLENLSKVCEAAGASLGDAAKITVYVIDMGAFAAVNDAYGEFFGGDAPPARVAVGVSALPKGAQVEVDAVVAIPE